MGSISGISCGRGMHTLLLFNWCLYSTTSPVATLMRSDHCCLQSVFAANAVAITASPHLWVCIGGRLHPWSSAAPAVCLLSFSSSIRTTHFQPGACSSKWSRCTLKLCTRTHECWMHHLRCLTRCSGCWHLARGGMGRWRAGCAFQSRMPGTTRPSR